MRRLKIGYFPYSPGLQSPGDRRRLLWWAKQRGHEIRLKETRNIDVVYFNSLWAHSNIESAAPKIFELIDGYGVPENNLRDRLRTPFKLLADRKFPSFQKYSELVKYRCVESFAVVCSSPEQSQTLKGLNPRIHQILDSHVEVPDLAYEPRSMWPRTILWEGQVATLRYFLELIDHVVNDESSISKITMVTDMTFFLFMNRFMERDTLNLISKKTFGTITTKTLPWSIENLVQESKHSNLSILPIDVGNPFLNLKPENRMLLMLRLGLPVLVSPTSAHKRVQSNFKTPFLLDSSSLSKLCAKDWFTEAWSESLVKEGKNYLAREHNGELLLTKWDNVFADL